MSIVFNIQQKEIKIMPPPAEWVGEIAQHIEDSLTNFHNIACILDR